MVSREKSASFRALFSCGKAFAPRILTRESVGRPSRGPPWRRLRQIDLGWNGRLERKGGDLGVPSWRGRRRWQRKRERSRISRAGAGRRKRRRRDIVPSADGVRAAGVSAWRRLGKVDVEVPEGTTGVLRVRLGRPPFCQSGIVAVPARIEQISFPCAPLGRLEQSLSCPSSFANCSYGLRGWRKRLAGRLTRRLRLVRSVC